MKKNNSVVESIHIARKTMQKADNLICSKYKVACHSDLSIEDMSKFDTNMCYFIYDSIKWIRNSITLINEKIDGGFESLNKARKIIEQAQQSMSDKYKVEDGWDLSAKGMSQFDCDIFSYLSDSMRSVMHSLDQITKGQ